MLTSTIRSITHKPTRYEKASKPTIENSWREYQLYIRSSAEKSKDFANSGEVKTPFCDAATEKMKQERLNMLPSEL